MRVVKASSSLGKRLVAIGTKWEGTFLNQVYDNWSTAKQETWDRCYDEYCNTDGAEQFSICSHNCQQFTCSWLCKDGLRIETPKNSYLVVFDE